MALFKDETKLSRTPKVEISRLDSVWFYIILCYIIIYIFPGKLRLKNPFSDSLSSHWDPSIKGRVMWFLELWRWKISSDYSSFKPNSCVSLCVCVCVLYVVSCRKTKEKDGEALRKECFDHHTHTHIQHVQNECTEVDVISYACMVCVWVCACLSLCVFSYWLLHSVEEALPWTLKKDLFYISDCVYCYCEAFRFYL